MITYDNIEVTFGDFVAIPNFNLTIEEGEFFTFLGPSGCGKTTALRALAGFVAPSKGRIIIGGTDVTTLPSDKRQIGMVFQNYALFPSMSVYENIAFGLRVAKLNKDELDARVRQIADEVNLTDEQLTKGVAELSGGQQQRVAIARALIMKPKILLLDEPLSNLDAKLRHQLRIQLKDLQSQFGITTVYVTHDQDEALSMSDRIAVMNLGRIEQVGTPQEIYTHSQTEFVSNFIGDVNKFTPAESEKLRLRGATNLSPQWPSYVRIEKVHLGPAGAPQTEGLITLDGVVAVKRYHGLHYSYEVKVGDSLIKAVVQEDGLGSELRVGEHVSVSFRPEHLRQYPEGEAI